MSDAVIAAIVDDDGMSSEARLAIALERSGFWAELEQVKTASAIGPEELAVVIKPDLGGFAAGTPVVTDPQLVEHLIDLLHDAGYVNVAVATATDSSAMWAENRDVFALADLLGYRYVTPQGRQYDIVDLSENLEPGDFVLGQVLHGSNLSATWRQARFRIVFAKNKTDEAHGYALCLDSLIGVLPLVDKNYYYGMRNDPGDVVAELLRQSPVHFALIDAVVSAHGSGGSRAPKAITTGCIIASKDLPLADYIAALKMGLDPESSPLVKKVRKTLGTPARYSIDGNLAVYPDWQNAHALIVDSTRQRGVSPTLNRLLLPWLQTLDPMLFPLQRPVDASVNAKLAPFFANVDADSAAFSALVTANYFLSSVAQAIDAYRVMYDKDAVRRVQVPLGLELERFQPEDYRGIVEELSALEPLLEGVAPQAKDLRWRYLEGAVLFEFTREIPVDYEEFVAKVDVARTIQYMNDYIGGVVVPVERDANGRVLRQAERNLYLAQPNYLVFAGGKPIDVTKLEVIEHGESLERMYWKTVKSDNGSAIHDDGIVTFARSANGVRARVFGRQLFVLPPFWQAMNLDHHPELKTPLVTHAYKNFFDRTFANFEAVVEGRDIRIGRAWHEPQIPTDTEPMPVVAIEQWAERTLDWFKQHWSSVGGFATPGPRHAPAPVRIDEAGFAHFKAAAGETPGATDNSAPALGEREANTAVDLAVDFWTGLARAVARDNPWLRSNAAP